MTTSGAQQGIRPGVCLSTSRPASPYIGQIIYMTDVNQSAVWNGTSWEGLERTRDRNVIINGAMQIAQRGTSLAGITQTGYYTADRFRFLNLTQGTHTNSIENDAPTGSGFRKSLKSLVTTADASPAAGDEFGIEQVIEGQNLQQFLKGTASAKQFSISFWAKSNVTGTYIAMLYDLDNSRFVSASYTISASATWEKKTITFPADTTGAFDNDNAGSLIIRFYLGAGSNSTSGTLQTTWGTDTVANRAVGQLNLAATLNNYWQVTGVQLEAGSVATPFEFEDFSQTLRKCQRYYWRATNDGNTNYNRYGVGGFNAGNSAIVFVQNPVRMRVAPTSLEYASLAVWDYVTVIALASITFDGSGSFASTLQCNLSSGGTLSRPCQLLSNNSSSAYIGFSAEL